MNLTLLRTQDKALVDLINYQCLLEPGVIKTKDGSFLAGFYYRGEDTDSLTAEEHNSISARVNEKLRGLGTGWSIDVNAIRTSATGYPDVSECLFDDDDIACRLIDEERRINYEKEDAHFETVYSITITYLPPVLAESKFAEYMFHDPDREAKGMIDGASGFIRTLLGIGEAASYDKTVADKTLATFKAVVTDFEDAINDIVSMERMTEYSKELEDGTMVKRDALVDFLEWCVTGTRRPVNLDERTPFLDSVLGMVDLVGGVEPIIDDQHTELVSISGFPMESYPGILSALDGLPLQYRWSNRFIYLDTEDAKKELDKFRKQWAQKKRGLLDQVFKTSGSAIDGDAVEMEAEAEQAMADASSQVVSFGYYTSTVVVSSEDKEYVQEAAKYIAKQIRNLGFGAKRETFHAMEAYLGSLPGHNYYNIRKPIIHTMNLTDLLPFSAVWAGLPYNPCDKYPENSPPLIVADTTGGNTFRLNMHVGDLGHYLVFGPTGSGKSTLLALIAAQFRKYRNESMFCFDKGYSMYVLCNAAGGRHFDIAGDDDGLAFCPLGSINSDSEQVWCEDWIRMCAELQLKRPITPKQKSAIRDAMTLHRTTGGKSLTEFVSNVQDLELSEALEHYTLTGSMGSLLDAEEDGLELSNFVCFEMEHLLNKSPDDVLPVITYLFYRIEKSLQGQPAHIMLDEAWVMLGHEQFREKIREWLKVLRKQNCIVGMATQSLSDAERSGILDVLVESCPTKIYLPNASAKTENSQKFYRQVGLNDAQIEIIASATPKRQYYAVSEQGYRLFELGLGEVSLAYVAKSGVEAKKNWDQFCVTQEGLTHSQRAVEWLDHNGVDYSKF